jgi:predicted transcriptional regulator
VVCWHTMRRTTIKLPDELDARLRHAAARQHTTISTLTRQAIEEHLGAGRRRLASGKTWRSGHSDISERIEELLNVEWRRASARRRRPPLRGT